MRKTSLGLWAGLGLALAFALGLANPASATLWYVHRTNGAIVWAGQYSQAGYATETLDDGTSQELQSFLNPPLRQAQTALAQHLALGITTSSQGGLMPLATWALDQGTQQELAGIAATVGLLGVFPDGTTGQYPYPDITSVPQLFPSVPEFKSFYGAYAKLLQDLRTQMAIQAQGGTASWPSQVVPIQ